MFNITELEKNIGYTFESKELLYNAMCHSSFSNEHKDAKSNERLEFLGDAILDMIVSERLYDLHVNVDEGVLSKMRAAIVREESLAVLARKIKINEYILLGQSEKMAQGNERASVLSDCFEAIVAAIYKDGGFYAAKKWLDTIIETRMYEKPALLYCDYKTILQEYLQKTKTNVRYVVVGESGPDHKKMYEVEAYVNNKCVGKGINKTKKQAEQDAARDVLKNYEVEVCF